MKRFVKKNRFRFKKENKDIWEKTRETTCEGWNIKKLIEKKGNKSDLKKRKKWKA